MLSSNSIILLPQPPKYCDMSLHLHILRWTLEESTYICFLSPNLPSLLPCSRLLLTRELQFVSWGLFALLSGITSLIFTVLRGKQGRHIARFCHPQCCWAWSELEEIISLGMRDTHLLKQWAAVSTQQLLRRVAPQSSLPSPWDDFSRREACQGQAPLEVKPHIQERRREKEKHQVKQWLLCMWGEELKAKWSHEILPTWRTMPTQLNRP